jgi:tetratricopeptide (TPR) repeat protein
MDVAKKIKSLLQEAELYRSQGLLRESIGKYQSAVAILQQIEKIKNRDSLVEGLSRKIRGVERELESFESAQAAPEISADVQDLIKEKFAFAKDSVSGALEGAIALAKFGQYGRALEEFRALLSEETVRVAAAKNILRCHISRQTYEDGVEEYRKWVSDGVFSSSQLENLRLFFQGVLDKRGVAATVAPTEAPGAEEEEIEAPSLELELEQAVEGDGQEEELLDISSIGVLMEDGPQKGQRVEYDVSFQSGSEISLLVPNREKGVIEHLKVGTKIKDIEFYSPFAMFQGAGIVTANTKIATGPKRGDFSLDIKVIGS